MIEQNEIQPIALAIEKAAKPKWSYWKSVKRVQTLYLNWNTISEELLNELWLAKKAITHNFTRKSGVPKKGERSWARYVKECFEDVGGPSRRTIDSYLARYFESGFTKPEKLTVSTVTDHGRLIVRNAGLQDDGRIRFEIYLPEHDRTYTQYIAA